MVKIELKNISYSSRGHQILKDVNLTIEDGEYCVFVGPTGAGKTTLIGLIMGIFRPNSGCVLFNGKDVTNLPPNERYCGVMFESYALFPHITILDNVCYSRHLIVDNREETHGIGRELLHLVHIYNRDNALPRECSGGMQQRVALARALMAIESSGLLILDEPFKALDAGLRMNLRKEVRDIVKSPKLSLTTIHITNDMQEAMMADKILVLDKGQVCQIGTPKEIMYSPVNLFVANFFSTELNFFQGKVIKIEPVEGLGFKKLPLEKVIIQTLGGLILYAKTERHFELDQEVTFLIRSQYFKARHKKREDKTNNIVGKVKRVKFMGPWLRIEVDSPAQIDKILPNLSDSTEPLRPGVKTLKVEISTTKIAIHNFLPGETITVFYPSEYVIVFPRIQTDQLEAALKVS